MSTPKVTFTLKLAPCYGVFPHSTDNYIMKVSEHTIAARNRHHKALEAICPKNVPGLTLWKRLRRLENEANHWATCLNNGRITRGAWNEFVPYITERVATVLGCYPAGLFVNDDCRGYALKLKPGSVQADLHTDWGGYQILAPEID